MKIYGRTTVSEFLGDRIVYRNLEACDPRLPRLDAICRELGLAENSIPRKQDESYARVVAHLLQEARRLEAPTAQIQRLIYLGDTRMSDGTAFTNLCRVGGWAGRAFIGSEALKSPAKMDTLALSPTQALCLANRWAALSDFAAGLQDFAVDECTAVITDLDKTVVGARGRNADQIDQARVTAVYATVADLLGESFNQANFQTAYNQLNQVEFHPFTTDNQDYLAYICLMLGSGLYHLPSVVSRVRSGELTSFEQFIQQVNEHTGELPSGLRSVHDEIYAYVQAGDPTPFKPFRRREFLETISRMGCVADADLPSADMLLQKEIVITQEVRSQIKAWQAQGALVFGLSDKPDEASLPTPELTVQGYRPIHHTETHAVGE